MRPEIIIRKEELFFRVLKLRNAPHWSPWSALWVSAVKASDTPSACTTKNVILGEVHLRRIVQSLGVKNYRWVCLDKETKQVIQDAARATKVDKNALKTTFTRLRRNSGHKLRGYQKKGIAWMVGRVASLNADDTGLGKSMQVLGLVTYLQILQDEGMPVMIVGSNIAGATWMDEVNDWYGEQLQFVKTKKDFRFPKPGEFLFCTWGKMPTVRQLRVVPPDGMVLVGDEIQAVKNVKTQRAKSWNAIKAMALARGGRVVGLSATPLENNPGQFWNVLHGCGIAEKCFGDFGVFKRLYKGFDGIYGIEWPAEEPDPAVKGMLKPWMLRRRKYDVRKDLPAIMPPRFIRVEVSKRDPVWAEMAVVEAYMEEHGLSVEDLIRLASTNEVDFLNLSRIRRVCALAKVKALKEYVEEYEEGKLIVMCCHREPIMDLGDREGWAVIAGGVSTKQRSEIKHQFNNGELLGVACTLRAANESITLTAANRMCFVDQDWNPSKNYQAMGRNNRFGQEASELYYDYLVIKDSIDEQVARVLAKKEIWIKGTLD